MKIGIDARMYGANFTGIGRCNYELIRQLSALDNNNEYYIFLRKEIFDRFVPPNDHFHKVLADFPHYSFGEQFGYLKLLNSFKLDLMHFTHFNAPIFYTRPFIVTIHDLTLSFFPGKKMTSFLHRFAYQLVVKSVTKRAKTIIAVSGNTKKDLQEVLNIKDKKVKVIYNGVSFQSDSIVPAPRSSVMQKYSIERPFFLYTGVWRDHKNVIGMIKAFYSFNKQNGNQYALVITGKPNPVYHEIPDLVNKLGVEDAVHLVGLVSEEELTTFYKNALVYVFPSFYEGFGLPPLEAMGHGTPVIASRASAIPEICGKDNALYFDPYNIDDMADKMKIIATDPTIRQRLIDNGYQHIKTFSWKKMTQEILNLYSSFNEKTE